MSSKQRWAAERNSPVNSAISFIAALLCASRAAAREAQSKAAMKEIAEFTGEFLSAAQRCFELIDKDGGGTLSIDEIV